MEQVLYKEALASVFEGAIKQTYEIADQECKATEHRSMIQAAKKAAETCMFYPFSTALEIIY